MKNLAALLILTLTVAGCSGKKSLESSNTEYGKAITLEDFNSRFAGNKGNKKTFVTSRNVAANTESLKGCLPYTTMLYNGESFSPGVVSVSNDSNDLIIGLASDKAQGFTFKTITVNVGKTSEPFTTFLTKTEQAYEYRIPFKEIGGACGSALNVSVKAEMEKETTGSKGLTTFYKGFAYAQSGKNTDFIPYSVCCGEAKSCGCTYNKSYWLSHSKSARFPATSEDTRLCGKTWYSLLKNEPAKGVGKTDTWLSLAHQWITAKLNVRAGASTPGMVGTALNDSGDLLAKNCKGFGSDFKPKAVEYVALLDKYNSGLLGPGHCE